jgi:hypothetical protein
MATVDKTEPLTAEELKTRQDKVVTEWLATGCPACHQVIHTDTPIYQPHKPGLYPALLFHFGVMHEGVTPPPAPHPDDEAALDSLIEAGLNPDGTRRKIPWRQQIAEAVVLAKRGVR